ncbi:MAG TPA: 5-oxoprolinase subunit PxpB [Pyrinomonadaceae bacterium]|jgi:inhibitor of KinA|nr:5-oxoprolinase subunit PxpB [Pyrinomonadaceae bacterium]
MADGFRIFPLGDSALTVEFGNEISVDLNQRSIALSDHFESHPFPGFIESVPAYASATIFYDVAQVRRGFPESASSFDTVRSLADAALKTIKTTLVAESRVVEIPVHFDSTSAPDLAFVAKQSGLGENKVIELFTGRTYRVFMLGFLPGFTYMAEVDKRIATPRKDAPRASVPNGSVGIAGKQTGIYSLESPGGWQIVGRTDVEVFTPHAKRPTLLQPGDQVRFVPAK